MNTNTSIDSASIANFTNLVRFGIGHQVESLIEPVDWNAIEALAERQGLSVVVLDGINRLPESVRPPKIMLLQWIGEVIQGYEQRYVLYRKAEAGLGAWYREHGFRMMLLKGLACGLDWPRPEHRPYGDIDIYLFGQYKEADAALFHELGIKVDNSHHHHTVFQWQGFTVENHYDFVNVHVHESSRELESIFKRLANKDDCLPLTAYGLMPPANLHALFLVRHMVSHFTGSNITLRQVLDWAFFVEKHGNEVDWGWLEGLLDKYHMKAFFGCVNAICVEDLGFNKVEGWFDTLTINWLRVESQLGSLEFKKLKERILSDTLTPEFDEETPKKVWKRMPFKYRRWKANRWKRELCYEDGQLRTFLGGVWNHLLKPAGI